MSVKRMVKWLNKHVAISMRHRREQHKCSRTRVASFCQGSLSLPASIEKAATKKDHLFQGPTLQLWLIFVIFHCLENFSIKLRVFPLLHNCLELFLPLGQPVFCFMSILGLFCAICTPGVASTWDNNNPGSGIHENSFTPQYLSWWDICLWVFSTRISSIFSTTLLVISWLSEKSWSCVSPLILFSFCFYHTPRNFLWLLRAKLQFACMVLLHQL